MPLLRHHSGLRKIFGLSLFFLFVHCVLVLIFIQRIFLLSLLLTVLQTFFGLASAIFVLKIPSDYFMKNVLCAVLLVILNLCSWIFLSFTLFANLAWN